MLVSIKGEPSTREGLQRDVGGRCERQATIGSMHPALTMSHWVPDGSGPPLLDGMTVGARLRAIAATVPERTALVEGGPGDDVRRWTYAELLRDAEACAAPC